MTVTRGFLVAFLDHTLRGAPQEVLGDVNAPTDVLVEVYPLQPPTRARRFPYVVSPGVSLRRRLALSSDISLVI